ncbi:MAG: hypothetical protein H0V45_08155 [Actinobacteria bacterium]|nr:hypothetical protein [Actinomycetota bacterium]
MARRKDTSDPDWRARWAVGHEEMARLLERRRARDRELEELDARRQARLRRLTLGLFGRP